MIEAPLWHLCTCNDDVLSEKTNPDQEIKYVDISNVDSKNGIIGYSRFVFSKAPSRARRLVKTGDIIVSTVRTYLEAIALVDDKYSDCVFSTGFAVLRPKNPNQSLAIYLSLKSSRVISAINAQSKGVAYPSITSSELMRIKVRLLEDTKRVSKLVSDIDNVISNKAKIFDSLSEYRQSLVAHVVTKGLDSAVAMKKSSASEIVSIPLSWNFIKLKYLARLNPKCKLPSIGTVEYLPMENIHAGFFEHKKEAISKLPNGLNAFQNGDILLAKVTPCFENGNLCIASDIHNGIGVCSTELFVLRPNKNIILSEYLLLLFQDSYFTQEAKAHMRGTGGLRRIPASWLLNRNFLIPPLQIQSDIVSYIKNFDKDTKDLINKISLQIANLQKFRKSVISDMPM